MHKINEKLTKSLNKARKNINMTALIVYPSHAGPSAAYSPEAMGYMMDSQGSMMHRPPGDPGFHQSYAHYPPADYYGHHL